MSEFVVSTRYANALMESSEEKGNFSKVLSDISFIKNTLDDSKELRIFLVNPIISAAKKKNALNDLFGEHIGKDAIDFINFLVFKGRENLLHDICTRFIELSNKKLNQAEVKITSAVDLNEDQKKELKDRLEIMLKKNIIPTYVTDHNIIGGFKAKVGDTIIDASIQHQLAVLKKKLFKENYLSN